MTNPPSRRFWFAIYAFTAVVMTIAVTVFAWLASESRKQAGEGRTANAPPPKNRRIPKERYELLARFEAPAYTPGASESRQFQQAMQRYSRGDFSGAIPSLQVTVESQPGLAAARFYLGICLLLTNDRLGGINQLRAVVAAGNTAYLEPARFYLAKGLLAFGDPVGAQRQLEDVIAMHGEMEREAQALLAEVRT